jgi:3-polyprenyl-4-hydroxybenzoate decarboxylase
MNNEQQESKTVPFENVKDEDKVIVSALMNAMKLVQLEMDKLGEEYKEVLAIAKRLDEYSQKRNQLSRTFEAYRVEVQKFTANRTGGTEKL